MKQNLLVALALAAGATQVSLHGMRVAKRSSAKATFSFVKPLAARFAAQSVKLGNSLLAGVRQHKVLVATLGLTSVVLGCEAYRPWSRIKAKWDLVKAERAEQERLAKLKKDGVETSDARFAPSQDLVKARAAYTKAVKNEGSYVRQGLGYVCTKARNGRAWVGKKTTAGWNKVKGLFTGLASKAPAKQAPTPSATK